MTQTAPTIHYALDGSALPADRLLRRILSLVSMIYGGTGLAGLVLHIALAKGWTPSPRNMAWALGGDGWSMAMLVARFAMLSA